MLGGKLHCYVVTPTLIVVQKLLKCDVTLLSIYNSDCLESKGQVQFLQHHHPRYLAVISIK
jgi:hypothetical protein